MAKQDKAAKSFFDKLAGSEDAFDKGKKGRTGFIEVEPGAYVVRCQSMELGVKDKIPYVHFNAIVVDSADTDDLGLRIADRIRIEHKKGKSKAGKSYEITEADRWAQVGDVLKAFGVDTDELELSELADLADQLEEEQPACKVTVAEKDGYKNVKWGKFVDNDDLPSIEELLDDEEEDADEEEDDEEEEGDDEEDESEDDDSDEDDEDEDEDDPPAPPKKGEEVSAKPKGARGYAKYEVTSVNKSKETCTLKRAKDDKVFKDQSWDCIK